MSHPSANSSSTQQHQHQHPSPALSASHIAAQAAFQHQNSHQHQQLQHVRQRSQTVPNPNGDGDNPAYAKPDRGKRSTRDWFWEPRIPQRPSGKPLGRCDHSRERSVPAIGQTSPGLPQSQQQQHSPVHPPPQLIPDQKSAKPEKSKVKLFSRPVKIGTKGDPKDKPLPSPSKIGSALASLQRGNFSTSSLIDTSGQSIYNLNNSSSATIRAVPETPTMEKEGKEKEKKHHFLSRQKHKLKDDYHLPLSSASSNSKPTDPVPPRPGPNCNVVWQGPAGQKD
ncbi:target of rapamycin complex 2 subunit BIT61 [Colletotrichum tofieldiae]|nr:target of rapamycin complex 2 subunit BIT61 [Colletotrichum tofieldiae]